MESIVFTPIGIIHTPFVRAEGTPIQPSRSPKAVGRIDLLPEFIPALKDLDGFSHITLLYVFHLSEGYDLTVVPYLDTEYRGLFATRAPRRPNAIGQSVVRLIGIEGGSLHIKHVDMLDGTPLLDIKPYVPAFDSDTDYRIGWLEKYADRADDTSADDRFHP